MSASHRPCWLMLWGGGLKSLQGFVDAITLNPKPSPKPYISATYRDLRYPPGNSDFRVQAYRLGTAPPQ